MTNSQTQGPLLGYVSDEYYSALSGAVLEFDDGERVTILTSAPSGAVYGELPPGKYRVTLALDGFTSKRSTIELPAAQPHQFRLLSNRMYGYAWPKWVRSGEAGSVRVHSTSDFRLTWTRHGAEREDLGLIGWYDSGRRDSQQIPDGDVTLSGVNWHETVQVVAPQRSGLYFFHAENGSGERLSFPWVVAPAQPASEIAVLASTNTWNAYNSFGGRSNYVHAARLAPTPTVHARSDLTQWLVSFDDAERLTPNGSYQPISFDRPDPKNVIRHDEEPTDPIRGGAGVHLVSAEWRLLSWLESNGFGHDFYSEAQLHDGMLDLDRYKVLVLSTHPEYWSRVMYQKVYDWVFDRGGKLAYFGGNGVQCEVEFVDSDRMTFLTYKPEPGAPFDSRMELSFRPTEALLGVRTTMTGYYTGAPYRVIDEDHWIYAGTGLKNGDTFGASSLHEKIPGGASAHETDKVGPHTPVGAVLVGKGVNPDEGGGDLVHFTTLSGGEVFSVGSIAWPASVLVDENVAAVTRNVLNRFVR